MKAIKWSIKNIVKILKDRQQNEFDGNIAVSGDRGNGKSVLLCKIFYRFNIFNPWKHQVYSRDEVIKLLKGSQYGICMDDEAINSGYKRDFQNKGQQELIKIITAYRDNFNAYGSAIPNFFNLDKDLRDLYFLHLHVIERGLAVVHMPTQGKLYSQDRWDAKYNATVEGKWSKKLQENPNFKPPYHRLTTFRGYLFFEDLTDKQKKLYKEIKRTKRAKAFLTDKEKMDKTEMSWINKVYNMVLEKKLTINEFKKVCLLEGKKYNTVRITLSKKLVDENKGVKMGDLLLQESDTFHNTNQDQIKSLISSI